MAGTILKAGDGIMKWVSMLYVPNIVQKIQKELVHINFFLVYWAVTDSIKYMRVRGSNAVTRLHNEIFNF